MKRHDLPHFHDRPHRVMPIQPVDCFPSIGNIVRYGLVAVLAFLSGGVMSPSLVVAESQATAGLVATEENASYASLLPNQQGGVDLLVNYPWHLHDRPSLEICLIPEGSQADAPMPRNPSRLVSTHLRGKAKADYYRAWDRGSAGTAGKTLQFDGVDWEVLSGINWRGTAGACAMRQVLVKKSLVTAWAAFWPLEPWSIDSRRLRLELPADSFREAGQMRIWFLRDEKVLWRQRLAWPGWKDR